MAKKKDSNDKRVEIPEFTDRFGNKIVVGDIIVYGNIAGRSGKTAVGKVLTIYSEPYRYGYGDKAEDRVSYSMRVCSIQDDTWDRPQAKNVTLTETIRILRYAEYLLSDEILDLLEKGELKGKCKCGHSKRDHWSGGTCHHGPDYKGCGCQKYEPE